jgi:hypothetical protein
MIPGLRLLFIRNSIINSKDDAKFSKEINDRYKCFPDLEKSVSVFDKFKDCIGDFFSGMPYGELQESDKVREAVLAQLCFISGGYRQFPKKGDLTEFDKKFLSQLFSFPFSEGEAPNTVISGFHGMGGSEGIVISPNNGITIAAPVLFGIPGSAGNGMYGENQLVLSVSSKILTETMSTNFEQEVLINTDTDFTVKSIDTLEPSSSCILVEKRFLITFRTSKNYTKLMLDTPKKCKNITKELLGITPPDIQKCTWTCTTNGGRPFNISSSICSRNETTMEGLGYHNDLKIIFAYENSFKESSDREESLKNADKLLRVLCFVGAAGVVSLIVLSKLYYLYQAKKDVEIRPEESYDVLEVGNAEIFNL